MRLLVTGATGFIGSHVVEACLQEGHETRALVRPQTPAGHLARRGVEVVRGDLTDPSSLRRAVAGVDAVLHLAALYAFWAPEPSAFERVNVEGTRALLRAAGSAGVRVVHCSTLAAVGAALRPDQQVDEEWAWNLAPLGDPYVTTKRRAEEVAAEMARRGEVEVVTVNPAAPIGPGDAKPTPTGRLVVEACNGLGLFWVDGGLNLVDVRDVARGHLLALAKGRAGERYILGGYNLTARQILDYLARIAGHSPPRFRMPHAAAVAGAALVEAAARLIGRPPLVTVSNARASRLYFFASSDKARRELGYEPSPLEPAMREAVAWFASHGYLRAPRARRILRHLQGT